MASASSGPQIQNRGTVGGNIANGSPAGDSLPVFAAADSVVVLRSVDGERRIPFNAFYTGYRASVMREQELRARVSDLQDRFGVQERDSIQYNIYLREADTNRQLYESLLQRYKEIGVAGVEASNISIIDPARIPQAPSSPRLALNLALALVVGLGLALAATIALEQIDEGLRDPAQVARDLKVALLGSVPLVSEGDAVEALGDVGVKLDP